MFSTWVDPFEPRKFPLTNEEFEKMKEEMPKDDDRGILYFPIKIMGILYFVKFILNVILITLPTDLGIEFYIVNPRFSIIFLKY